MITTTKAFISKSKLIHNDKYDYSLIKYKNARSKVKIVCPVHGIFEQTPRNHLQGNNCYKCSLDNRRLTNEQFINKAKQIHGDRYSYELVKYKNKSTKVKIVCSKHGVYKQSPGSHLQGRGCPKCAIKLRISSVGKLTIEEDPYIDSMNNIHCLCSYCGKYFIPTRSSINARIKALNNSSYSDNRLYCSDGCKRACPIYKKLLYPDGFKSATSREVQPQLRKLVLERDNWTCQGCESTEELHCHHMEGIEINPIESADVDNCITLCKKCHKKVHKDCNMKRKKCEEPPNKKQPEWW